MVHRELQELLKHTHQLSAALQRAITAGSAAGCWPELQREFAARTGRQDACALADQVAQAVTCGHFAVALDAGRELTAPARRWCLAQAEPLCAQALRACLTDNSSLAAGVAVDECSATIAHRLRHLAVDDLVRLAGAHRDQRTTVSDFYERLLSHYDARSRRRQGVYFTPPHIVRYVVQRVDAALQSEFSLSEGLADRTTWRALLSAAGLPGPAPWCAATAPFVRVLDPAMGTGLFLLEAFDQIRARWVASPAGGDWDDVVADDLLARLCGQELLLPAVVVSQLLMTARLSASGFRFARPGQMQLHLGNTLSEPRIGGQWLADEPHPYTVVVGNPPFSGVSANDHPWIRRLLRGQAPGTGCAANYFEVDGRPLGERKHWLEDDYVKFLRLAHWLIERSTAGVVGFVTNHGFLDNVTFRGMRQQLLATFSRVTVIDLHGNKRTGERPPHGTCDESVFGIEQGVAISLWRRPLPRGAPARIEHAELWGRAADKLSVLDGAAGVATTLLEPHAPHFCLVPRDRRGESEYARGWSLAAVMPVNSTAAVTARDSFVVAFCEAELRARLAVLCDPRVPDADVRSRFFTTSRSPKYPPGDTRGWQLAAARQRLRAEPDWSLYIRDCLYRPFDRRTVFWAPWMIDWPRTAVMTHLADGGNVALVARRQVPASHPCNYFWVTDTIALDGLIRSDNRGSESVFPLLLVDDQSPPASRRVNFSAAFVDCVAAQLQLNWNPHGCGGREEQFSARELFQYIYALLHAPSYQRRFAAWLRVDYPRVFVPSDLGLFRELAACGAELVASHLLRTGAPPRASISGCRHAAQVSAGGPRLQETRIRVNAELSVGPVTADVWEFRAGAHQVCRKWLKDRRGRTLNATDLTHYCQMLRAIEESLACVQRIDRAIEHYGGWDTAFA